MILGHQILMMLGDLGGPGVHFLMIFEARELMLEAPILTISWIFVILMSFSVRKRTSFLRSKCDHEPTFCSVVFHCFFECPFFLIVCDLECPETLFWEAFGITFPAEARNQKSVFGLQRRVRIAYPAFWKMHFCATFSILVFGALRRK